MNARDLTLFLVTAVFGIRWIPIAAAAGPSSLLVWVVAGALLLVPLIVCTIALSRRYVDDAGGLYSWVKRAFGEYPAFVTAWTYWASNLPFFPAVLYFAAANALLILPGTAGFAESRPYFIAASLVGLAIAVIPNLLGIRRGRWVQNVGAFGVWIPTALVIVCGVVALASFGSATSFDTPNTVPRLSLDNALAWSAMAFGFGGVETVSLVSRDVRDPTRTIRRAVIFAAVTVTSLYVLGTTALLVALPSSQIGELEGVVQAFSAVTEKVGLHGLTPFVALLVVAGAIGGVGAWLLASSRLPYVAGAERYLPSRFAEIHPTFGTPVFAMLAQATIAAVFIVIGQAGTTVRGAYALLVAMAVIAYFIPFLFMFAAAFKLVPRLRIAAAIGFAAVAVATALAFVPPRDDPNPALALAKIVGATVLLLAVGTALYTRRVLAERRIASQA